MQFASDHLTCLNNGDKIETNNYQNELHTVPILTIDIHQQLLYEIRNMVTNSSNSLFIRTIR